MKKLFVILTLAVTVCVSVFAQTTEQKISFFINDVAVQGKIYKNDLTPPIAGPNYMSSFVDLENAFKALGAKVESYKGGIRISGGKCPVAFDIVVDEKSYKRDPRYQPVSLQEKYFTKINGRYYIAASMVRYLIQGTLKDDEKGVYLYTADFVRVDIPGTLEECYQQLDQLLSDEDKSDLKKTSNVIQYHRTLGMWIRNEWIYPGPDRVAKIFLDKDIRHPDDISHYIMLGYHFYLNGKLLTVDQLLEKDD